jgi:dihydroorotase
MTPNYDLLIHGGRLVDPARDLDGSYDVAIVDGRVAAVAPGLSPTDATEVVDATGMIVAPGLIDLHTHVYWGASSFGVDPEQVWEGGAVTTLVDTGSAGAANFPAFRRYIIDRSPCRILAFLHISVIGLTGAPAVTEANVIRYLSVADAVRTAEEHRDVIVGIKVRATRDAVGDNGLAPLELALAAGERLGLPVMVHIAFGPPALTEILPLLRPRDILTHSYSALNAHLLDEKGRVRAEAWEARRRGVLFDCAHGRDSLSYDVVRAALEQGFPPDTISTDLHSLNRAGPVRDLPWTMSKFLALGMGLREVVERVTWRPAQALGWSDRIGTLQPGRCADVACLRLQEGEFELQDSAGEILRVQQVLRPALTVRAGAVYRPKHGS